MKKYFCVFSLVLLSSLLCLQSLSAQSKTISWQTVYAFSSVSPSGHNLYYDTLNGVAIVTYPELKTYSNHSYPFWGSAEPTGNVIIPDSVINLATNIKYPVEKIRDHAFWACSGITAITIPSTIKTIEQCAFDQCTGLTTVYFNADTLQTSSSSNFNDCTNFTTLIIGNNVRCIPDDMFKACSGLTNVVIPNSVVRIGNMAFRACSSLTSITIGRNVKYIGNGAFAFCNNLTSINFMADSCLFTYSWLPTNISEVTIGNNVKIIPENFCKGLSSLNSIQIPDSVSYIGQSSFYNCSSLSSITLPSFLDSIGADAFYGCTGLNRTSYNGTLESWCQIDFANASANPISKSRNLYINDSLITHITIPTTVCNIKSFSFCGDTNILSIILPNTIHSIGESSFSGCNKLPSVSFPDSLYTIETGAFSGCNSLSAISLPNSLTIIGERAFANCTGLTSVFLPNSLLQIGSRAFTNCSSISSIILPNTLTTISDWAFSYCSGLSSVTLPDSLVYIDDYAFFYCSNLSSISFPNTLTAIGTRAFDNDTMLSVVRLMGAFSHVGDYAFQYCIHMDSLFLGKNIDTIGTCAFRGCSSLKFIKLYTHIPPVLMGYNGFNNIYPYPLFVTPCNSRPLYVSEWGQGSNNNWTYADFWIPMEFTINVSSNSPYSYGTVSIIETNSCSSTAVIKATPSNYHYYFVQWNDGVTTNPRTIDLVQDTLFSATFGRQSYTITCTSNNTTLGSVSGGGTVEYLDTVSITATANTGCHFTRWNDNNTTNPRTITVTSNQTFTAYFDYDQYILSVNANNTSYGSVSGGGSYHYNTNHTINATANYGYHFTMWSDGNTNNPRTITLTQDTAFTALFAKNIYTITTISADTIKGSVIGSTSIEYLDSVTIVAIPNYGYHFTAWNDGNTDNPRIVLATKDSVFTASFGYNQYTITLYVDTDIHGLVVGGGTYNYLSEQTVTATANYGYHFTAWSDGNTNNPRNITLTQDTSFTALFAKNQYMLTLQSDDVAHGSVIGGGVFDYLDTVAIEATAVEHYHFVHWSGGNTDNPRQYVITGDNIIIATFAIDTHHVSVESCNIAFGSVAGSGDYEYGTPATVTATAYSGYQFAHWSNGDTHNPYTFAVLQDTTLVAIFKTETQGIDDVIADAVNVYTLEDQIVVETELKEEIGIYDIVGRKVDGGHKTRFDVPASGVYLVKIGTSPIQKVVIVK